MWELARRFPAYPTTLCKVMGVDLGGEDMLGPGPRKDFEEFLVPFARVSGNGRAQFNLCRQQF